MTKESSRIRPGRITALSLFFFFGSVISLASAISLLFPNSILQPMWRLNPRAHQSLATIGLWAPILLIAVSSACASAALGLWFGKLWGYRLALILLIVNLVGDIYNLVSGTEPRAIVGIPIVALILTLITTSGTKAFFRKSDPAPHS